MSCHPAVSHTSRLLVSVLCVGGLSVGCAGDPPVVFPPGLEPLEENTAPWPKAERGDPYPEKVVTVSGEDDGGAWVHARGYVHDDVDEVWKALQDPDVVEDRRRVSEWSVTQDTDPRYDISFTVHNVVYDVVTIEFDILWIEGVVSGTLEEPEVVGVRFEKVEGTSFIDAMAGSVTIYQVEEGVTAIELIERLDAYSTGETEVVDYMTDLYASVVADVAGRPLPTYDD